MADQVVDPLARRALAQVVALELADDAGARLVALEVLVALHLADRGSKPMLLLSSTMTAAPARSSSAALAARALRNA